MAGGHGLRGVFHGAQGKGDASDQRNPEEG
jgi:hypothetical protein